MNQIGNKVKNWSEFLTLRVNKWMRGMDSMLGEALSDWIEQEKRVIAYRKQTKIVEEQLNRHDQVIHELIMRLHEQHEQKDVTLIEQQSRFHQMLRKKIEQIEILNRQLQEKEEVVVKSRMAIQQLMFKVDESKSMETNLKLTLSSKQMKLEQIFDEKKKLEEKVIGIQNDLLQSPSENEKLLKDQLRKAMSRILEIKNQEISIKQQNMSYEQELQKVQQEKKMLHKQVTKMEQVRDELLFEKSELLQYSKSQEEQIHLFLNKNEQVQLQLMNMQKEKDKMFELLKCETKQQEQMKREKEEVDKKYEALIDEWGSKKKEYEYKEKRLERRLGRRIGNAIPNIFVEPEFEKDYLYLSEDEQAGVDAALYELSLGWHTGNVHFRSNSVKGRTQTFLEYAWGVSHQIPGRVYVKKENKGFRIYRISRTKEGGHRMSQKRVIEWLKNQ